MSCKSPHHFSKNNYYTPFEKGLLGVNQIRYVVIYLHVAELTSLHPEFGMFPSRPSQHVVVGHIPNPQSQASSPSVILLPQNACPDSEEKMRKTIMKWNSSLNEILHYIHYVLYHSKHDSKRKT